MSLLQFKARVIERHVLPNPSHASNEAVGGGGVEDMQPVGVYSEPQRLADLHRRCAGQARHRPVRLRLGGSLGTIAPGMVR